MMKRALSTTLLLFIFSRQIVLAQVSRGNQIVGTDFRSEKLGIEITLPEGEWYYEDKSLGPVMALVLRDSGAKAPVIKITIMPVSLGIKTAHDLNSRLATFLGDKYHFISLTSDRIHDHKTELLVFDLQRDTTTIRAYNHSLIIDKDFYQIQFSYPVKRWSCQEKRYRQMIDSITFFPRKKQTKGKETEEKSEEQTVELSDSVKIISHDICVEIDPLSRSLVCFDRMQVQAIRKDTRTAEFKLYDMKVDSIKIGDEKAEFSEMLFGDQPPVKKLTVTFPEALDSNQTVTLDYYGHKYNFLIEVAQSSVTSYNILGQINEESSYSSHVWYYPLDKINDAPGEIRITVPRGYTAVSTGTLIEKGDSERTTTYHYRVTSRIPRQLPFGFAVGKYHKYSTNLYRGIHVEIYTWEEFEDHARRRMKLIGEIIGYLSQLFGPFPLEQLTIVHVKPRKGIAGVSLPGMILLSDLFFLSNCSYEIIGQDIQKSFLGPLILVDEIAHQWNTYSVSFPNELAEGLSQYTDALFAEHIGGKEVLQKHMEYLSAVYKASIENNSDVAIAVPEVHRSKAYQGIVFCKGAVVLNMLRQVMGDSNFFAGLRDMFTEHSNRKVTYDDFRETMEHFYGASLKWFFDQWYQRPGYPVLDVQMTQLGMKNARYNLSILIEQKQEGELYKLPLDLAFSFKDGTKRIEKVMVERKFNEFRFEFDSLPLQVHLDKEKMFLLEVTYQENGN